jgi:outer membrane protein assembly factor BamB
MKIKLLATISLAALALLAPAAALADEHGDHGEHGPILYGGTGGHGALQDGSLIIIDQTSAAVTFVGKPAGVARISGLAFDEDGRLWGSTASAGPPPVASNLIEVDPEDGSLISSHPITAGPGGPVIGISDLAAQPETDVLYGVESPADQTGGGGGNGGKIYRINKKTGVATFICRGPVFGASIAFAPNGTFYENGVFPNPNPTLYTLDPSTCAVLKAVPTAGFFASLAVRPSDGVLFGGDGDFGNIFKIDPTTGAETLVGNTSPYLVGDLAFPIDEGEHHHKHDGGDD